MRTSPPKSAQRTIYVKWFRHWRTGRIIYAEDYGKTVFRILIR